MIINNIQPKLQELADLLEEHMPPHFIEEVRGQMLDLINNIKII